MIIKTNGQDCYFYCNISGTTSKKFIKSPKLSLYYNGKKIDNVYLNSKNNLIIAKDIDDTTYIVDDGYRNSIIRAGYLIYKNYDEIKITDKNEGNQIHDKLVNSITKTIKEKFKDIIIIPNGIYNDIYALERDAYMFTIGLYDNIDIVKKNQERKINGLQFYPFDKRMDNYGTLYITIYCQRISDDTDVKNITIADSILKTIVDNTEDIKFTIMNIENPLYYTKNGGDI